LPQLSQANGPEKERRLTTKSSKLLSIKLTFFGVDSQVFLQIALRSEKLIAISGQTIESIAEPMQAQMGAEPITSIERLGAVVFAAMKRFLLGVHAHMDFQRVAGQELLGAPFFGACELVFA
jgi:hypothetical protein